MAPCHCCAPKRKRRWPCGCTPSSSSIFQVSEFSHDFFVGSLGFGRILFYFEYSSSIQRLMLACLASIYFFLSPYIQTSARAWELRPPRQHHKARFIDWLWFLFISLLHIINFKNLSRSVTKALLIYWHPLWIERIQIHQQSIKSFYPCSVRCSVRTAEWAASRGVQLMWDAGPCQRVPRRGFLPGQVRAVYATSHHLFDLTLKLCLFFSQVCIQDPGCDWLVHHRHWAHAAAPGLS